MAPFGTGNMRPVFLTKSVRDTGYGKSVGTNGDHLKLKVTDEHKSQIDAIGFNLGNKESLIKPPSKFDIVYILDENEWQGVKSLQLKLKDLKS
jgi:single-stranded-DNA-specific exonuclease